MTAAVAVVPLRGGAASKTRLASVLGPRERAALVVSLARHVVATLAAADGVTEVLVVGPPGDDATRAVAGTPGPVRVLVQPAAGLNAAVELGRATAAGHGGPGAGDPRAPRLVVVHGDLPALTPDDVAALLAAPGPLILAADRAGTGTNALVLTPSSVPFGFRFGPGSLAAHGREAERLGLRPRVLHRAGTAVDLDTAADWAALPPAVRARLRQDVPALARLDAAG